MNLQSKYAKYIKGIKAKISAMSPEERIAFAHKIANEIKLNKAKLKDNKDKLNADSESLDVFSNLVASPILGGALGTTISLLTGGDSTGLALTMALGEPIIAGSIEIANPNTERKYRRLRPITDMKRRKTLENIENLERESDALDEIKEHLNETYGIKVKVPASRTLGLDREM